MYKLLKRKEYFWNKGKGGISGRVVIMLSNSVKGVQDQLTALGCTHYQQRNLATE